MSRIASVEAECTRIGITASLVGYIRPGGWWETLQQWDSIYEASERFMIIEQETSNAFLFASVMTPEAMRSS